MSQVILYIEPFSGASGDMFLSALCGLTDSYDLIASLPKKLNLEDGKIEIQELNKNGIVCKHIKIIDLNVNSHSSHSHTHHHHNHGHHHHGHDHDHHHDHMHLSDYVRLGIRKVGSIFGYSHSHNHSHSHDHQRGLKEIHEIIDKGDITPGAKQIAKDIFQIIGKSESTIHNVPLETIHFHEVSAVDSILDIVGCAVLLDLLNVKKSFCDAICTGYGTVKTQHGILPVPAPATFDIIKGMPIFKGDENGEKLTPTGAAILQYLKPSFDVPNLKRIKTAYGPGQKDFRNPNVIRISVVEESNVNRSIKSNPNEMMVIEFNVDDSTGEFLGQDFQEQLLAKGATDFYYTFTQMKKGRPGLLLSVLVHESALDDLSDFILDQTTTIGLRYYPVSRKILNRRHYEIDSPYGVVQVKEVTTPSGLKRQKIEYESLKDIAKNNRLTIQQLQAELYDLIRKSTDNA